MTQALEARLGGSPFGPAGTGKTETVKALGNQLGRFVLVFNCDETFDFQVCCICKLCYLCNILVRNFSFETKLTFDISKTDCKILSFLFLLSVMLLF